MPRVGSRVMDAAGGSDRAMPPSAAAAAAPPEGARTRLQAAEPGPRTGACAKCRPGPARPRGAARGKHSQDWGLLTTHGHATARPAGTGNVEHAPYSSAEEAEGRTTRDSHDTQDSFAKKRREKRPPPLEVAADETRLHLACAH